MKLYIILAAWPVTKDNHAGMYYLAKKMQESLPCEVQIFKLPVWKVGYLYPLYRIYTYLLALYLWFVVKPNDIVWLMEYLLKTTEQAPIARLLKGKVKLLGIAHLVPAIIDKQYTSTKIKSNLNHLDKIYVLGSSLKSYFEEKDVSSAKIHVTYHYVDTDYYRPDNKMKSKTPTVICMGNMERDYSQLQSIVKNCPNVSFIICAGRYNLKPYFDKYTNVRLVGYLKEDDLKKLMQSAHLSLNVMKDTIGSNVIVSSLATGLPLVCSAVGSISDYVIEGENGFLFNTPQEAVSAINNLVLNKEKISRLSEGARKKALQISLDNFIRFFIKDNSIHE